VWRKAIADNDITVAKNNIAIEMQEIGRRYGSNWILSHLNLAIRRGESVALFGNNGSGKTTLLRMMATLLPPSTGKMSILGYDLDRQKREIRSSIRYLGHEKQLYDKLTIMENMRLAAGIRGLKKSDMFLEELLDYLQLREFKHRRIKNLSEGMKKRLVLTRLLLGDPDIVFLDEPHPTLDLRGREILNDLIRQWRKKGKTIVTASHDHEQVLRHVDRLIILLDGSVFYDGAPIDPEEILRSENRGDQA
jgi:heme ABC exporter ATP-binding subunit CcmA